MKLAPLLALPFLACGSRHQTQEPLDLGVGNPCKEVEQLIADELAIKLRRCASDDFRIQVTKDDPSYYGTLIGLPSLSRREMVSTFRSKWPVPPELQRDTPERACIERVVDQAKEGKGFSSAIDRRLAWHPDYKISVVFPSGDELRDLVPGFHTWCDQIEESNARAGISFTRLDCLRELDKVAQNPSYRGGWYPNRFFPTVEAASRIEVQCSSHETSTTVYPKNTLR